MKHAGRFLLTLLLPLLLAACGQKGALYFPDQAPAPKPAHHAAQISLPFHSHEHFV